MKINNANEFYNFLKSTGSTNINPDASNVVKCIEEFQRMCACDPPAAKNAKLNQCRTAYVNFAHRASQFKDVLLSKINDSVISFYIDGQPITNISR